MGEEAHGGKPWQIQPAGHQHHPGEDDGKVSFIMEFIAFRYKGRVYWQESSDMVCIKIQELGFKICNTLSNSATNLCL